MFVCLFFYFRNCFVKFSEFLTLDSVGGRVGLCKVNADLKGWSGPCVSAYTMCTEQNIFLANPEQRAEITTIASTNDIYLMYTEHLLFIKYEVCEQHCRLRS